MGRPKNIHTPIKYFTEKDRKEAIKQSKTKYMMNGDVKYVTIMITNYLENGNI